MRQSVLRYFITAMVIFLPLPMGYALEIVAGEAELATCANKNPNCRGDETSVTVLNLDPSKVPEGKAGKLIGLYQGTGSNKQLFSTTGQWLFGDSEKEYINWKDSRDLRYRDSDNSFRPSIAAYQNSEQGAYLAAFHTNVGTTAFGFDSRKARLYLHYGDVPGGTDNISRSGTIFLYSGELQEMFKTVAFNDDGLFVFVNTRGNLRKSYIYLGKHLEGSDFAWPIRGGNTGTGNNPKYIGREIIYFKTDIKDKRPGGYNGFVAAGLNNNNEGILIYRDEDKLYYRVFLVEKTGERNEDFDVRWMSDDNDRKQLNNLIGFNPHEFEIDINEDGLIAGIGRDKGSNRLAGFVGQLQDDLTVDFETAENVGNINSYQAKGLPGNSLTNEGYLFELYSNKKNSDKITSHLSILAGEKVIQVDADHWQSRNNNTYGFSLNLSNPRGIYKFGLFAKEDGIGLRDVSGRVLLSSDDAVVGNYYTFTAQTTGLELKGTAGKAVDELIGAVTVNRAQSDYKIFGQPIYDSDGEDITELLDGKVWEDNEVTFDDEVFEPDALFTLGFSVSGGRCVHLVQEGVARFSATNTSGTDKYYLVPVFADEAGALKLTLDTADGCAGSEAISMVEIFTTNTAPNTFVRDISSNDWGDDNIVEIPDLAPHQIYSLEGIRFGNPELVLKNLTGETLIGKPEKDEVYAINQIANGAGGIGLELISPTNSGAFVRPEETISLYHPYATTIASFEEGDSGTDGNYFIAGLGGAYYYYVRACFSNEEAEISYEKEGKKLLLKTVSDENNCRVDSLVLTGETILSASEDIGKIEVYKQQPLLDGFFLDQRVPSRIELAAGLAAEHLYILKVETKAADVELVINDEARGFKEEGVYIFQVTADAQGQISLKERVGAAENFGEMQLYLPSAVGYIVNEDWLGAQRSRVTLPGLVPSHDYYISFTASSTTNSNPIIIQDANNNNKEIEIPRNEENEPEYFLAVVKTDATGKLDLRVKGGYGSRDDIFERLGIISTYQKDKLSPVRDIPVILQRGHLSKIY